MKAFNFSPSELERIQTSLVAETHRLQVAFNKARKEQNCRLQITLRNSIEECIQLTSKITIEVDKNMIEDMLEKLSKLQTTNKTAV